MIAGPAFYTKAEEWHGTYGWDFNQAALKTPVPRSVAEIDRLVMQLGGPLETANRLKTTPVALRRWRSVKSQRAPLIAMLRREIHKTHTPQPPNAAR